MIKTFANFVNNNVDEGNAFTAALKKAQESGAEEFEFEGKTYKTKGNDLKEDEEAPAAPVKKLGKLKTFEEYVKEKDDKAETPEDSPEIDKEVKKQEETDMAKSKAKEEDAEEIDAEEIADADSEEADEVMDDAKDKA
jgi:hypothetical protein